MSTTRPGNRVMLIRHYESNGRPLGVTEHRGDVARRKRLTYASLGAVEQHIEDALAADGETPLASRITTFAHNAQNQLSAVIWNDGSRTTVSHDQSGRMQPIHLPNGQVLSPPSGVEHLELSDKNVGAGAPELANEPVLQALYGEPGSAAANEVLRFEANERTALRRADEFGRTVAIRNPGQSWKTAICDAADRLVQTIDASGSRQRVTYDLAGRLIELQRYAADMNTVEETVSMRWHGPFKAAETVSGADGTIHLRQRYEYNAWGQLTRQEAEIATLSATTVIRLSQSLRYNAAGQLTACVLPSGERIAYRYVASEVAPGALAQIEQIAWPSWIDGLMTRLPERWQPKTVLARLASPEGTLNDRDGNPALTPDTPHTLHPEHVEPKIEPGLEEPPPGLDPDADGLPRLWVTAKGRLRLTWNAAHQLVEVRDDTTNERVAQYRYDARGRRTSKVSPEGSEYYLYESTQLVDVVRDVTPAGDTAHRNLAHSEFLYQGYRAVAWLKDKVAYRLQSDHRGAITATTSPGETSGSRLLWASGSHAWGAVDETAGRQPFDPRLRLANQYAGSETGLSYNVGRYYDPQRGRFISPDPAGVADSLDAHVPDLLKLDITVYAAGQPFLFFDPDGAARLIYYAITTGANGLLPEIQFGAEDAPINVTTANANGARLQRILNCTRNQASTAPMAYGDEAERNRVEKYVAAAELNEVSRIGRDCSQDGCPGVDIVGQTGTVYHASYGRTQFIGSTFLDTIEDKMSAADQAIIGVTPDILQRIQDGRSRARAVERGPTLPNQPNTAGAFTKYRNRYTCATAANAWDNAGQPAQPPAPARLTLVERNNFQTQTGLGRQAFIDMICFVPAPPARPIGEARAAFGTEAIFTDTVLRDWMMNIFRDADRFDLLSRLLIRSNLHTILNAATIAANFQNSDVQTLANGNPNPAYATRQRQIEEELAMRVGRLHNGGTGAAKSTNLDVLTRACTTASKPLCDMGNYVNKYVGNTTGFGEWRSLRCAENPTTGTGATSTVQALQMTALQL